MYDTIFCAVTISIIIFSIFIMCKTEVNNDERYCYESTERRLYDLIEYFIETTDRDHLMDELKLCGITHDEYVNIDEQCIDRMFDMCNILDIYFYLREDNDRLPEDKMPTFIDWLHKYYIDGCTIECLHYSKEMNEGDIDG